MTTVNILHLAVHSIKRFWRKEVFSKSGTCTWLNAIHTCTGIRIIIDTFKKKKLIQVHANMFKNQFLPYIVHVKYTCTTLTVPDNI